MSLLPKAFHAITAAIIVAFVVTLMTGAMATATKPDPNHKVTICHALPASASHAYNRITVDIASSGYVKGGHYVGGYTELGFKHANGGDIIPPYTYKSFQFPGQNWTAEGQAIYENGCVPPPPCPDCTAGGLVTADLLVCGDPRVLLRVTNQYEEPITIKVTWTHGGTFLRQATYARVSDVKVFYPFWVRGRSYFKVTAFTPEGRIVLERGRLPKASPWGTNGCPASLATYKRDRAFGF